MVDYKKWDDLNFSSDEDDCHPNIEINTWRRLKERYRKEHGLVKKEPQLIDKWSSTVVNNNNYDLMNVGDKENKDGEENKKTDSNDIKVTNDGNDKTASNTTGNNSSVKIVPNEGQNNNDNNVNNTNDNSDNKDKNDEKDKDKDKDKENSQSKSTTSNDTKTLTQATTKVNTTSKDNDNHYYARSDPAKFLEQHKKEIEHFASIKNDNKANEFIIKNYELVHEATEGFLITHAVDRAVEGCNDREKKRLATRCLQIHNLVQSCSTANVGPQKGVQLFFSRLSVPQIQQQYQVELNNQIGELLERIEKRRQERLKEQEKLQEEEVLDEDERAPLGPGGLDPTEVLNSLPEKMKDAFLSRDVNQLRETLAAMPHEEAEYHFRRCIDAGLWVENINDENNKETIADNGNENDK